MCPWKNKIWGFASGVVKLVNLLHGLWDMLQQKPAKIRQIPVSAPVSTNLVYHHVVCTQTITLPRPGELQLLTKLHVHEQTATCLHSHAPWMQSSIGLLLSACLANNQLSWLLYTPYAQLLSIAGTRFLSKVCSASPLSSCTTLKLSTSGMHVWKIDSGP